jgi:hypothetical protein
MKFSAISSKSVALRVSRMMAGARLIGRLLCGRPRLASSFLKGQLSCAMQAAYLRHRSTKVCGLTKKERWEGKKRLSG